MNKPSGAVRVKTKLFRGLADASRLAILEALRGGPRSVSDVVKRTGLSQPNASMHLDCLWCCGLVEREIRGRFRYYSINSKKKVIRLLQAAEDLLKDARDRIAACSRYRGRA